MFLKCLVQTWPRESAPWLRPLPTQSKVEGTLSAEPSKVFHGDEWSQNCSYWNKVIFLSGRIYTFNKYPRMILMLSKLKTNVVLVGERISSSFRSQKWLVPALPAYEGHLNTANMNDLGPGGLGLQHPGCLSLHSLHPLPSGMFNLTPIWI